MNIFNAHRAPASWFALAGWLAFCAAFDMPALLALAGLAVFLVLGP